MARLMIVDDSSFMRMMLKGVVSEKHEVVAEASDGSEVLELYKKYQPDLVTLDITMPNVNGLEALKELKSFDKNVKVIMCSAMGQQAMVVEAIQSGASDFIVKPFDKDRVLEAINKIVKK